MTGGNPAIGAQASKGGHARAKAAKAKKGLTLEEIEAALPPLDCVENAQEWLRRTYMWAGAGVLARGSAAACARCVEVWLRAEDQRDLRNRLATAERRIREMEAERKADSRGPIA
jgi:hypothetical protein